MSERMRESLSALMDDAGDDLELGRVLRGIGDDEQLLATWERYHLVRAVMTGRPEQVRAHAGIDLEALHVAIAADADEAAAAPEDVVPLVAVGGAATAARSDGWRLVAGFAAAACVTLALVVTLQPTTSEQGVVPGLASAPAAGAAAEGLRGALQPMPGANSVQTVTARSESPIPLQRASADPRLRMEALMLHHAEHSAVNSSAGMVPFARMASFDESQ